MQKKKWYAIPSYTMKCRLYLNKKQKELFDKALYGIRIAYNSTLYDMKQNYGCTKEKRNSKNNNEILHFPDFKYASSAEHLNKLREENPAVRCLKVYSLSGKNGVINQDLKRSLSKIKENKTGKFKTGETLPFEYIDYNELSFICNKHPRRSMTFQIVAKNIYLKEVKENNQTRINKNVLYVDFGKFGDDKFGEAKVRGWNQKIRFDENGELDFIAWLSMNLKKAITITLSVDNCGDYWICFKFSYTFNKSKKIWEGIPVYKQFSQYDINDKVGLDVGKKALITCSNDKVYKNGEVENKRFKANKRKHLKALNRQLSRRLGWANIKFRDEHKKNIDLKPSNNYEKTRLKIVKLNRKIVRKRNNYYNEVTTNIVKYYGFIGIESLSVSGMFDDPRTDEQKDINSKSFIPKKYIKRANDNTADAAMGEILRMLKYKSEWYERICQEIGRYFPSSKQCHICGYIKKDLTLKDREWICPKCGTLHDRDENAAKGIEIEAWRIYTEKQAS